MALELLARNRTFLSNETKDCDVYQLSACSVRDSGFSFQKANSDAQSSSYVHLQFTAAFKPVIDPHHTENFVFQECSFRSQRRHFPVVPPTFSRPDCCISLGEAAHCSLHRQ